MITTSKNIQMTFVRFDAADEFPPETLPALLQVRARIGQFEYGQLENGKWCIRTVPSQLNELPLAAIGKNLDHVAQRMLIFCRLGNR